MAKQLQVGLRIIEPIPEEQEEDLEASNGHLHVQMEQPRVEPIGGEQEHKMEDSDTPTNKETTEQDQGRTTENDTTEIKMGLKEVDTITRVLGEVIAKRKHTQENT